MIDTISALKTNTAFSKLAKLQTKLDTADTVMSNSSFTRSPFQVISFLVTYAGLNASDRAYVVNNLPKDTELSISKEELDSLIGEINWSALLNPSASALKFELKVGINDPDLFYKEIKKHAPQLLEVLKNKECVVKIERNDKVVFTTVVEQDVSWVKPLDRANGSDYWTVPDFSLSEPFKQKIAALAPGESWNAQGGFSIKKGNSAKLELHIRAPKGKEAAHKKEIKDLEVDAGIYNAYKNLKNFYGLPNVDKVNVKLSNIATFSDIGATASQTQVVKYLYESACFSNEKETPTIITIESPLNVYYQGIDIIASVGEGEKNSVPSELDPTQYYINLPVKQEHVGVRLYPTQLTALQVHDLNFNSSALKMASSKDAKPTNYNFLFKMGMALTALTTLASIVVVALALSLVITLPPVAIGAVAAVGVTAAVIGLVGFFNKGREKPINEEVRQESSLVASI